MGREHRRYRPRHVLCEAAPAAKLKANIWLKDLSGKNMLLTLRGEKFVNEAAQIAAGCILQVDNCTLLKRGENNIEATAEDFLDSEKHSFSYLHRDPQGEKADKLRALDTSRGAAISVPRAPAAWRWRKVLCRPGPCCLCMMRVHVSMIRAKFYAKLLAR